MPNIQVTDLSGKVSTLKAKSGETLMEALRDNGYSDIEAVCGGVCSCSTCHVYLEGSWFDKTGERSEDENQLVTSTDYFKPNSRLSCQVTVNDDMEGMVVTIAHQSY
ncbi:MAG TPA: 2Fe-2S iron-sulfur cluster-binding protein [Dongiaceae bacterium]|nr:2Fe-2S iron-sulfur cluster-binding protein [Dongiaceae bacterium]